MKSLRSSRERHALDQQIGDGRSAARSGEHETDSRRLPAVWTGSEIVRLATIGHSTDATCLRHGSPVF